MVPARLQLTPAGELEILWTDGHRRRYRPAELLAACPCANCRRERGTPGSFDRVAREDESTAAATTALPVLGQANTGPTPEKYVRIAGMDPIGNYAYAIRFENACSQGIYRFELLRELGEPLDGTA